jgi:hypothetical protein
MSYSCCAFFLDVNALSHYGHELKCGTSKQIFETLLSSIIPSIPESVRSVQAVVVKTDPLPALGIIGEFDAREIAYLKLQLRSLPLTCGRLKYVDQEAVVTACENLAVQFLQHYNPLELQHFCFTGIPRGGLIVLGILSYLLQLKSSQLTPPFSEAAPLVIVDDCILSGERVSHVLQQTSSAQIILAPLFIHPDCRSAILAQEKQVSACWSGADLVDRGVEIMGANYPRWQQQNLQRLAGMRYWLGLPDYLCFPWNEPDYLLWNAMSQTYQKSWPIVPPQLCLKNRRSTLGSQPLVYYQPAFSGIIQPTPDTVFTELGQTVIIGHISTGATYFLQSEQVTLWRRMMNTEFTCESAIADSDTELYQFFKVLQSKEILEISLSSQETV